MAKVGKMEQKSVTLPVPAWRALRVGAIAASKQQGRRVSVSELLRAIVQDWLADQGAA